MAEGSPLGREVLELRRHAIDVAELGSDTGVPRT
jgi:hypothetical protein